MKKPEKAFFHVLSFGQTSPLKKGVWEKIGKFFSSFFYK